MTYALVTTFDPGVINTSTEDATGVDLIVMFAGTYNEFGVMGDTEGNTYSYTTGTNDSYLYGRIGYKQAPTVDASMRGSVTTSFAGIGGFGFSGSVASPLDQQSAASTGGATSLATGSITPTENDELIITGATLEQTGTYTVDGSFTTAPQLSYLGASNFGVAVGYKIQTSLSAENRTWSTSGASTRIVACIASFKVSGGGGGGTRPVKFAGRWAGYAGGGGGFAA